MRRFVLLVALTLLASPALAQDESDAQTVAAIGRLQVQLSQMDEQMRQIHGQIEQLQFQQRQAADAQKRANDDVDFRLKSIGSDWGITVLGTEVKSTVSL